MSFQNCKIVGVGVNSDTYHSRPIESRGTPEYIMSPSSLKTFMECASRWKAGYEPPESEAKDYGNLIDCLLLTPESFKDRYSIKPDTYPAEPTKKGGEVIQKPWNGNSTWCRDWIALQGDKTVISGAELTNAQNAVKRLMADETIAAFHKSSNKQVHVKGEWHDKATGLIIPVQCLIDFVPKKDSEFQKSLGDLKSTRNAGQRPFQVWSRIAKYHIQAAFDLDLYMAAVNPDKKQDGEDRLDWIFILSENFPPYETGRRILSQDKIQLGRLVYQDALAIYAASLKTGKWSGYDLDEEFTRIEMEPFEEYESLSNHIEQEQASKLSGDDNTGITP